MIKNLNFRPFLFILTFFSFFSTLSGKNYTADTFPMTWQLESGNRVATTPFKCLAPDVQRMDDGSYRMYYTVSGQGVGSAVSQNGLDWTIEDGMRVTSMRHDTSYQEGSPGFDLGHPWLVRLDDGRWRMYLQASTGLNTPLQIMSAISSDAIVFEIEPGLRVAIGEQSGPPALSFAGHGRAMKAADGNWLMVFSGNMWDDQNPSDIILASSQDGIVWQVTDSCVANNGHDPTLLQITDGTWAMVYAYLKDNLQVRFSNDGLTWSEPDTLRLLDESGQPMSEIYGDVALMRRPDGGLRLMSNAEAGIASYIPVTTGIDENIIVPQDFVLYHNFPNPFNQFTVISFSVPDRTRSGQLSVGSRVEVNIYDVTGCLMLSERSGYSEAGNHQIFIKTDGWPTGIYVYEVIVDRFRGLGKMMLVK